MYILLQYSKTPLLTAVAFNSIYILVYIATGLQKFSDQSDIRKLFNPGAWDRTTHLVFTEKANGENAKVCVYN